MYNILSINREFNIIGLSWFLLFVIMVITSCGSGPQKKDTKETAEEHNDSKFATHTTEDDAQYLVDAYSNSLYEIEASQHAKQKATRNDVKDLASQMIEAHVKLNESIESAAGEKQISLQQGLTDDQLKEIKDCSDKKGLEYDKAYIDKIIDYHEKAIKLAEKAAEKANDAEIRNLFSGSLSNLRHHLEMAMAIKDKMSK